MDNCKYKRCVACKKIIVSNSSHCVFCGANQNKLNVVKNNYVNNYNNINNNSDDNVFFDSSLSDEKTIISKELPKTIINENVNSTEPNDDKKSNTPKKGIKIIIPIGCFILTLLVIFILLISQKRIITYENTKEAINNNPESYSFINGTVILSNLEKEGYIFQGWYKDSSFKESITYLDSSTIKSNVTLYAKWELIEYNIYYNLVLDDVRNVNPEHYNVEQTIALSNCYKDGYDFIKWTNNDTGEKIDIILKGTTGDLFITANWKIREFTITYHSNLGEENNNPTTATIDDYYALEDLYEPGYIFCGWFLDEKFTKQIDTIEGLNKNIDLYAKWEVERYDVIYNLDGGYFVAPPRTTYVIGDSFSLYKPKRDGFNFVGWIDEHGNPIDRIEGKDAIGGIIVTAQWDPIIYRINYYNTKGADNPNPTTYNAGDGPIMLAELYLDGYTFNCWIRTSDKQEVSILDPAVDKNVSVTADWTKN